MRTQWIAGKLLIAALAVAAGSLSAEDRIQTGQPVFGLPILRRIEWPGGHEKSENRMFAGRDEFRKAWEADAKNAGVKPEMPRIEWGAEMVAAVFAGTKPSGGYSIAIEGLYPFWDAAGSRLYVMYREKAPEGPATQAPTQPNDVVVTTRMQFDHIQFVNADSEDGRKLIEFRGRLLGR